MTAAAREEVETTQLEEGAGVGPRSRIPVGEPPAYEHLVEPEMYFAGLLVCLLASMCVLWSLVMGDLTVERLLTALGIWTVLSFGYFRALKGVRYGTIVRLYQGYVEVAELSPPQVLSREEISHFRDRNYDKALRRRMFLYLRTGVSKRLPRVSDPDRLSRGLSQVVGLDRML